MIASPILKACLWTEIRGSNPKTYISTTNITVQPSEGSNIENEAYHECHKSLEICWYLGLSAVILIILFNYIAYFEKSRKLWLILDTCMEILFFPRHKEHFGCKHLQEHSGKKMRHLMGRFMS